MSIHPDPTSGLLLTDPVSGAVFRLPARPDELEQPAAADWREVLDVWGEVYRLPAGALAPYRLSAEQAEAAAAGLLADPEYLAHLVRELGVGELGMGDLGNLVNAQTPEAFASAVGGENLAVAETRLSALEERLAQAKDALAAAPTLVQTNVPSAPADPSQHSAMLALLGLLSRVSPQWIGETLAGKQRTPPAAPLSIPLPALPSFEYADLLGRPLEADREG
ncbi:hypothetical protein E7T06_11625 [Deinococcus sp. Arct2-2]|uniref:hypothetical protein n=1 Tax=Deinococcus sp. Arct2-2 TaxID=2568653 RepID=UPI0010A538A7|nr:hypothetical protein [Deinococcus sp. Arct2-2]THF69551.1 hypothetical protein E7T06_11625 [Deinococcus sp. Arct2-2]